MILIHTGRLFYAAQVFELVNLHDVIRSASIPLASFSNILDIVHSLADGQYDIPFEYYNTSFTRSDHVYRRQLSQQRSYCRSNDLERALPPGMLESLALPFQTFTKVLTTGLAKRTISSVVDSNRTRN